MATTAARGGAILYKTRGTARSWGGRSAVRAASGSLFHHFFSPVPLCFCPVASLSSVVRERDHEALFVTKGGASVLCCSEGKCRDFGSGFSGSSVIFRSLPFLPLQLRPKAPWGVCLHTRVSQQPGEPFLQSSVAVQQQPASRSPASSSSTFGFISSKR